MSYLLRQDPAHLRLPLQGGRDLTYRCNNNCRHCWLWTSGEEAWRELTADEIKDLVDQARRLGCQSWQISGGEPMLRPDFPEIFDYITRRCTAYTLNTNGTLITPEIAGLMKRKGSKMVALYGATQDVHDFVTRNPGSFQATMQGFQLLQEAGAGFVVQIIPMRANYHQLDDMKRLAKSLSPHWRIGAPWIYLSHCRERCASIAEQRLPPEDVISLDLPDLSSESQTPHCPRGEDDRLYAACISHHQEFYIDPYGGLSFCCFVKDPKLRYDLRQGSLQEAWESFIPGLADKVLGGGEYRENCGSCDLRPDCRWCDVYGYLEHGRHGARVGYLCRVARACREYKEAWKKEHRRFFQIAGITLQVDSDLPFDAKTLNEKFSSFQAFGPGDDAVMIRHHFELPDIKDKDLGKKVYRKPPWAIYRKNGSWIYLGISPQDDDPSLHCVAVFNHNHTRGRIYNDREDVFRKGNLHSLTLFPSDQILLAPLLADRNACFIHCAGFKMNGKGLLFIGHSTAGKSTTVKMLKGRGEILCDDRNIVRLWPDGFHVHGTWSHGEVPEVSSASAPLKALIFLSKSDRNSLKPLEESSEVARRLIPCLIRAVETQEWWQKTLSVVEALSKTVPAYEMEFDQSGEIVSQLEAMCRAEAA